jgi:hypothetical protein
MPLGNNFELSYMYHNIILNRRLMLHVQGLLEKHKYVKFSFFDAGKISMFRIFEFMCQEVQAEKTDCITNSTEN